MTEPALLSAQNISKSFGAIRACQDVSLSIRAGEIVALLGENGAGKSTFVKLLYGALQPDSGVILVDGAPVALREPAAARRLGIGMVHQHFSLFDVLTAAQNIALVVADKPMDALREEARTLSEEYGLPLDADALVADLSVGERQRVEIVRCLMQHPRLIIMDEPTSVLTPQEAERLFATLRKLASKGCAILYISHKLDEVRALCQRAVVMRQGAVVGTFDAATTSAQALAEAMVGSSVPALSPVTTRDKGAIALDVRELSAPSDRPFGTALDSVSFSVPRGEIFGIAGMAGNGQGELFAFLSGERRALPDAVSMFGTPVGGHGVDGRRALGAAFVPEERLGHSAVPGFTLADNIVLSRHRPQDATVTSAGFLRRKGALAALSRVIGAMDVRAPSGNASARALSGGNLQKFVVGRELDRAPDLIVINQPTWGVDAGAAANIRQALIDLAAGGAAVVVISQDLDELFQVATRLAVMSGGRLSEPVPVASVSRADVGLLMGGASVETAREGAAHAR